MDSYTFKKMEELKEELKSNDIAYFGTLSINETDKATNKDVQNTYDIYVSIEFIKGNKSAFYFKFYNKDSELLAIKDNKRILPTEDYLHTLSKDNLRLLNNFSYSPENSFNQINQDLEKISSTIGISKEEILAISETDAYSRDSKKTDKNDQKIHLKDKNDKNSPESETPQNQQPENKAKLEALEKQSTDLNQKVSETETLGDILGISEGGKLVAVYSDSIENGTRNNTKFSFLLKDKDGKYSEIPNIEQAGGINPNTDVAQSNENGDTVKKEDVNSIYRIKGTGDIEYLLTANIGPYGTIELGIGQRDKTQGIDESDLVTAPLKTSSTYYTNRQTREAINSSRAGTYQPTERANEFGKHNRM